MRTRFVYTATNYASAVTQIRWLNWFDDALSQGPRSTCLHSGVSMSGSAATCLRVFLRACSGLSAGKMGRQDERTRCSCSVTTAMMGRDRGSGDTESAPCGDTWVEQGLLPGGISHPSDCSGVCAGARGRACQAGGTACTRGLEVTETLALSN